MKPNTAGTRFSRRVRGSSPKHQQHSRIPLLPTEIKCALLAEVTKSDLKSFRLVSKDWCFLATLRLFDKVYISSRDLDLQVFQSITSNPDLCAGVRSLIWDTTLFYSGFCGEDYCDQLIQDMRYIYPAGFDHGTTRFYQFINDIRWDIDNTEELYVKYQSDAFFVDGFQVWTKNAKNQRLNWGSESGHYFLEVLRKGV